MDGSFFSDCDMRQCTLDVATLEMLQLVLFLLSLSHYICSTRGIHTKIDQYNYSQTAIYG